MLTLIVVVPLAANTIASVAVARWSTDIRAGAEEWLDGADGTWIEDVRWHGTDVSLVLTDSDGVLPDTAPLAERLSGLPSFVTVVIDVGVGDEIPVR